MAKKNVSGLRSFLNVYAGEPVWMGIDVHKRSYSVALICQNGYSATLVMSASPDKLIDFIQDNNLNIAEAVYEAGPTGFLLAHWLDAHFINVKVVAPSKMLRPVLQGAKTDRLDCLKLAELASKGMVHPIAIPELDEDSDRSVARRWYALAESLRRAKQRIRSLLLHFSIQEPQGMENWSKVSVDALRHMTLPKSLRMSLDSLLRELDFLNAERSILLKCFQEIAEEKKHQEVIRCLKSVPGVADVVATLFRMELFQPERFRRPEEVAGYLGLAPVVRQSGDSKTTARLQPVRKKRLRGLLVQSAWQWKAKDDGAAALFGRLMRKHGVPQKAITAVARKLAIVLWRLSVEVRCYRPSLNN